MSIEEYLLLVNPDAYRLDLSRKNLKQLPDLSKFTKLFILDCSYNELTSIPDNLPNSLDTFYCGNNKITSLPSTKGCLPTYLRYLYCDNNYLTSLPDYLPIFLRHLNCSFNRLTYLPSCLSHLQILNCSNNQLTSLPSNLSCIETLICNHNNLIYLPDTLSESLGQLNCSHNQLTSLPDNLSTSLLEYDCTNNNFSIYPDLLEMYSYFDYYINTDEDNPILKIISYIQEMNKLSGIQKCREWLNTVNKNNVFSEIYESKIMNPVNLQILLQNDNMDIDLFMENYTSSK